MFIRIFAKLKSGAALTFDDFTFPLIAFVGVSMIIFVVLVLRHKYTPTEDKAPLSYPLTALRALALCGALVGLALLKGLVELFT